MKDVYYEDIFINNTERNNIIELVKKYSIIMVKGLSSKDRYKVYRSIYYPYTFTKIIEKDNKIIKIYNRKIKEVNSNNSNNSNNSSESESEQVDGGFMALPQNVNANTEDGDTIMNNETDTETNNETDTETNTETDTDTESSYLTDEDDKLTKLEDLSAQIKESIEIIQNSIKELSKKVLVFSMVEIVIVGYIILSK